MFSDDIWKWLDIALDIGLTEQEFWCMTFAELNRAIMSHNRKEERKQKEFEANRAAYDYILADLIGRSVARLYSSTAHMPEVFEVYPKVFNDEKIKEQREQKEAELSALRFRMFADSFNKRIKEVAKS